MSLTRSQRRARAHAKAATLAAKVARLPLNHPLRVAASGYAPKTGSDGVSSGLEARPVMSPLTRMAGQSRLGWKACGKSRK